MHGGSGVDKPTGSDAPGPERAAYDEEMFSVPDLVDGERLILHAERLAPQKRRVVDRVARISKRTVAVRKRIEVEVELLHEELYIEYERGDGLDMTGDKPLDVRIVLHAEHAEVVKAVRPVEEIHVSTRQETTVRRFSDTVRHEVLDVKPTHSA